MKNSNKSYAAEDSRQRTHDSRGKYSNPAGNKQSNNTQVATNTNWSKVKTHAWNAVIDVVVLLAAEWVRYRIDLYFSKKKQKSEEQDSSTKENGYGKH